jgi:hypothetical protein
MAAVKTSLATTRTNSPGSVFCSHRGNNSSRGREVPA